MIPVLSREEMRAFDAHAIQACRVPSVVLMENAGRGAADAVEACLGEATDGRPVVVVCGGGNNGGDGFVVARHLTLRGRPVAVHLVGKVEALKGDARVHYDAFLGVGGKVDVATEDLAALRQDLASCAGVVDALFGTGLDRPLKGVGLEVVELVNRSKKPVVAVDVPSGMDSDTGVPLGASVRAAATVTFAFPKRGLLTPSGAELAGPVRVADIGVPSALVQAVGYSASLLEVRDVARTLSPRRTGAHKGTGGHLAVFAGSPGKVGAALLVARAALRTGAGLVTIVTWPEAAAAIEGQVAEVMIERLDPADLAGSVDRALEGKRAVAMGPGFGAGDEARAVVEHVLSTWEGPSLLDADALTLFAGRPEGFASSRGAPVLTPHPGELGRLLGMSAKEVEADRFAALATAVSRARCVVVLKGAHTLIGAPDEKVVVNGSGNPALATAGAGDTLSGIVGTLLCGLDPFEAAWSGVYLHGLAADLWRASVGEGADRGLLAHEVADHLPAAFQRVHSGDCPD